MVSSVGINGILSGGGLGRPYKGTDSAGGHRIEDIIGGREGRETEFTGGATQKDSDDPADGAEGKDAQFLSEAYNEGGGGSGGKMLSVAC